MIYINAFTAYEKLILKYKKLQQIKVHEIKVKLTIRSLSLYESFRLYYFCTMNIATCTVITVLKISG